VVDVAGNLALTPGRDRNYRAKNPKLVSAHHPLQGALAELPGKIKAQQGAKRVASTSCSRATDALAAGIEQGLWTQICPAYAAKFRT